VCPALKRVSTGAYPYIEHPKPIPYE